MRKQLGFTLTEVLVAAAIGLISSVIIFKALQSSNVITSNVQGGSDSGQAGIIALYSIERDARMAGYGINYPELLGCNLSTYRLTASPQTATRQLAPLIVNVGDRSVYNNPDSITISYAGYRQVVPSKLQSNWLGDSSQVSVANTYDMSPLSLFIVGEVRTNASLGACNALTNGAPCPCSLYQVTGAVAPVNNQIPHSAALMNNGTGLGIPYSKYGKAFPFGTISDWTRIENVPVMNRYFIDTASSTLRVQNLFFDDTPTILANNVVNMYAQYMLNDGTFTNTQPASTTDWQNVTGLRIAVLTKSQAPDYSQGTVCKTNPGDPKSITPPTSNNLKTSFGYTFKIESTEGSCYRYRIFETTVTMRNMVWRP